MKNIILVFFLTFSTLFHAQTESSFFTKTDAFLNKYVKNGKVTYEAIKKNSDELTEILKIAADISIDDESVATQKAFWINAYNLNVIKGVLNKFPIKSPLDISGFFDKITYQVANKKLTLNDIESKMIRSKYKDPRFHFALVCGALGCPPIINKAYLPATVEAQLTNQTRIAINNSSFIKVNDDAKSVALSQIFEWYKDDFVSKGVTYIDFLNKYKADKIPDNYKTSYYTYDWALNKVK